MQNGRLDKDSFKGKKLNAKNNANYSIFDIKLSTTDMETFPFFALCIFAVSTMFKNVFSYQLNADIFLILKNVGYDDEIANRAHSVYLDYINSYFLVNLCCRGSFQRRDVFYTYANMTSLRFWHFFGIRVLRLVAAALNFTGDLIFLQQSECSAVEETKGDF